MLTRRELHHVHKSVIAMNVLRTHPCRLEDFRKVLPVLVERPAEVRVPSPDVAGLHRVIGVRYQVVMVRLPRAVPQAAGVRKDAELLSVCAAPVRKPLHCLEIALYVASEIVRIKKRREIPKRLERRKPHVHGGANLDIRGMGLDRPRDEWRRHGAYFRPASPRVQRFQYAFNAFFKGGAHGFRPVAVGVKEKVEPDAGVPQPRKVAFQRRRQFVWIVLLLEAELGPPRRLVNPREIHFPDSRMPERDLRERRTVRKMLVSRRKRCHDLTS